jgi:hypothetical protein
MKYKTRGQETINLRKQGNLVGNAMFCF